MVGSMVLTHSLGATEEYLGNSPTMLGSLSSTNTTFSLRVGEKWVSLDDIEGSVSLSIPRSQSLII